MLFRHCPLLFVLPLLAAPALACVHGPTSYDEVVSEGTKQALLFHDGRDAHLVVSTQLRAARALPPTMAWVIPLPSLPSRYEEADPKLFSDLYELTEPPLMYSQGGEPMSSASGSAGADEAPIRVHASQSVGGYTVQPVEIVGEGEGAAQALNAWLSSNGFGTVPAENQSFYLKKGAVFLSLKIGRLSGALSEVKPLHIVYPSDRLSLPLKFSSHSGTFGVLLYTFTTHSPHSDALSRFRLSWSGGWSTGEGATPPSLQKLVGDRPGHLTRFGGGFNSPHSLVTDLEEDPVLLPDGSTVARLPAVPLWLPLLGASGLAGALVAARGWARSRSLARAQAEASST